MVELIDKGHKTIKAVNHRRLQSSNTQAEVGVITSGEFPVILIAWQLLQNCAFWLEEDVLKNVTQQLNMQL